MARAHDAAGPAAFAPVPPTLPSLGEALADVVARFDRCGALGALVIDASALGRIEGAYGCFALQQALNGLGALVTQAVDEELGIDDLLLLGETGRNEMLLLVFRDPSEVEFYLHELPDLRLRVAKQLDERGHRVGYPFLRQAPPLHLGTAVALRNPTIAGATQVRRTLEQARSESQLQRALEARKRRNKIFEVVLRRQIRAVYEPVVEVATRTVYGYEALARGPAGSPLHSPAALFRLAEEEDLLFELDCLCRQSALEGALDLPGNAKLFLNIRPTTIHDPNFREDALRRTLERWKLSPSDVVFEISEQESIGNFSIFREIRDYYGKLGFQIALDDTGSGYASLEAVMELCPEFIKVDRAFVKGIDLDPSRQELLRALQGMAEPIGARIIGEGLDTLEELETLGRLGIPYGQGWLFGKPHPLRADVEPV